MKTILISVLGSLHFLFTIPLLALEQPSHEKEKMEYFLDGVISALMDEHKLTAATLSVVDKGEVLIEKAYGHPDLGMRLETDPRSHLFRIGSISKLFIWIAVLQQVEAGKLELDRDVNDYLEAFRIPATFDKPVTLRSLMSHTPGFEDILLELFIREDSYKPGTAEYLQKRIPRRVRPPLQTASYSNYGAGLAQYLVELVSGMAFEDYAEKFIFEPLNMRHTTLRQPLPETMRPLMTRAYAFKEGKYEEKGFEVVPASGIGGVSSTAHDMALFMQALLNGLCTADTCLLDSSSFELMQTPVLTHAPGMNPALHGFMDLSTKGVRAFGHGGNTFLFHSNLVIMPDQQLGLFVSFSGEQGGMAPAKVYETFIERFFPDQRPLPPAIGLDESYLKQFTGTYKMNRHSHSDFFKLPALAFTGKVTIDDGKLLISDPLGETKHFLPVDSLTFREEHSNDMVAFKRANGRITEMYAAEYPIIALERLNLPYQPILHIIILVLTLLSMAYILIVWPWMHFIRRRYDLKPGYPRPITRTPKSVAWIAASCYLLFIILLAIAMGAGQELVFGVPLTMKIALFFPLAAIPFIIMMIWFSIRLWSDKTLRVRSKFFYSLASLAFVAFTWQLYFWNLLGWTY